MQKRGDELLADWVNEQLAKGKKPKDLQGTKFIYGDCIYELGRYTKAGFALKMYYGAIRL